MKKTTHHLIAEVPLRQSRIGMTIGIDLGDDIEFTRLLL
jgi:hypothetical protein